MGWLQVEILLGGKLFQRVARATEMAKPMRSETFNFQGTELEDGRIYVTSDDLPGFRLVVSDEESLERELTSALRTFYPIYIAAKARAEASNRQPRLSKPDRSRGSYELSAEFSFA
jgi:hypothetical protein